MKKGVVVMLALVLILTGCSLKTDKKILTKDNSQEVVDAGQKVDALTNLVKDFNEETPMEEETTNEQRTVVVMKTTAGDITIELYDDLSPKTVENFLSLAKEGFYDGILFHRVIPDFMIQAGDPITKEQPTNWALHGTGGPGYTFADEFNKQPLVKGSFAMANAGPNTNGSQFFIVTAPATPWLDGRHTNFGMVIDGMSVVTAIENAERDGRDHPLQDIKILGIDVVE